MSKATLTNLAQTLVELKFAGSKSPFRAAVDAEVNHLDLSNRSLSRQLKKNIQLLQSNPEAQVGGLELRQAGIDIASKSFDADAFSNQVMPILRKAILRRAKSLPGTEWIPFSQLSTKLASKRIAAKGKWIFYNPQTQLLTAGNTKGESNFRKLADKVVAIALKDLHTEISRKSDPTSTERAIGVLSKRGEKGDRTQVPTLNAGHLFGSTVRLATGLKDFLPNAENLGVVLSADVSKDIIKTASEIIRIDADVKFKREISEINGLTGEFAVLTLEFQRDNTGAGASAGRKLGHLRKIIDKEFKDFFASKKFVDLEKLRGSPSPIELVEKAVVEKFLKNKVTKKSFQTRGRASKTHKSKRVKVRTVNLNAAIFPLGGATLDLPAIMRFVNDHLHDAVKAKMGKGQATQTLNYRTGRFARSAEVKQLITTRENILEAYVTYLRNPYDVFRPGGRLHKPLRDPEKIIGKGVRALIRDNISKGITVRTRLI